MFQIRVFKCYLITPGIVSQTCPHHKATRFCQHGDTYLYQCECPLPSIWALRHTTTFCGRMIPENLAVTCSIPRLREMLD